MSSFVHLGCHTEYSVNKGVIKVDSLVNRAASLKMNSLAVTDVCNLFASVKFYKQSLDFGIKPIIGVSLFLNDTVSKHKVSFYCQNEIGYKNLIQLVSRSYTAGMMGDTPTITWEWIRELQDGLIVLSGAQYGDLGHAILSNNKQLSNMILSRWLSVFHDRYYIEITRTGVEEEHRYVEPALDLAIAHKAPIVATNNVLFLRKEDFTTHEARVCINSGKILNRKTQSEHTDLQYLRPQEEMINLFRDIPEAAENTVEISKRCNLEIQIGSTFLPKFNIPKKSVSLTDYLKERVIHFLRKYLSQNKKKLKYSLEEYEERIKYELKVINSTGFSSYFLIVSDFISWAERNNIPVGPGRGSGAGSLVAFCMGITKIDPIRHGLLFERFLNPERVSMPDFDIDFCVKRRDDVINYISEKYGKDSVSQIITYGKMSAKAVVRDVGRVLGVSYGYVDRIAKLIPFELGVTLDKALSGSKQLLEVYKEREAREIIDLAMKLEGVVRNAGKHAGGVVISPSKITDFSALYSDTCSENIVTQLDKDDLETVGLIKFDLLGLTTLTIIQNTVELINKHSLDINSISLDDTSTYNLLKTCQTTAVFQLESRGMKDLIKRLQPDSFEDVTALVALFRPGPLQSGMVDDYIERKHGISPISYLHPSLESILHETYGIILYQEQVMRIARDLGGYSLGDSDILRRAMGKKKPEEMMRQREVFIKGAKEKGIKKETSEAIFNLMEKFAGYGFNKSHSVAYALLSYQTAWLKTHYPEEFMTSVLSADLDNTEKVIFLLEECKSMNLMVNSPDINICNYNFSVNNKEIEYGLGAIKGVGEAAGLNIEQERSRNGPFTDIFNFCDRVDLKKVNKRTIEALISSGSMDCFGKSRMYLSTVFKDAVKMSEEKTKNMLMKSSLFSFDDKNIYKSFIEKRTGIEQREWDKIEILEKEKSALGYYLSGHPINIHKKEISQFLSVTIKSLPEYVNSTSVFSGMILNFHVTKLISGKIMALLTIVDDTGEVDVTLFTNVYKKFSRSIKKDQVVVIKGKVTYNNRSKGSRVRILAETIETLEQVRDRLAQSIKIKVPNTRINSMEIDISQSASYKYKGECPLIVEFSNGTKLKLGESWAVSPQDGLLKQLRESYGRDAISVVY